ncbi:transcriptional family amidohydrolase family protein [Colletotrichum camelliae]|nr:transcriptional family amidohydrolase family protein [Colletotrichum camelliae]
MLAAAPPQKNYRIATAFCIPHWQKTNPIRASAHKATMNPPESKSAPPCLSADCWDTHVHVFDSTIGPFAASRAYTPAQATLQQLLNFSSILTKDKALNIVLVQPSPYGSDNTVLLHLLRNLRDDGAQSPRGIAVVDIASTSDEELWSMHDLGIRGLRINMQADGKSTDVEALRRVVIETAARIKVLPNWKIQLFCAASTWDGKFSKNHLNIIL